MSVRLWRVAALALVASAASLQGQPSERRIAVTFDDLPVVSRTDIASHERITDRLLASIVLHRVPAIGFVNEDKLRRGDSVEARRVALLRRWVEAGLELGNHTYSHRDLHRVPLAEFQADIARGDSVTRLLLAPNGTAPRWFRHPFLHTGRDLETRNAVTVFLASRGYRVAPVTVDNSDYIFAAAYEQAGLRGDSALARRVADEYVTYMERVLDYYERQSQALFGREIRQVLLLHANALNADRFGALAAMMLARGYAFVPLDSALADPAYASDDTYVGAGGITWLHRWALTRGKRGQFFAGEPEVAPFVSEAAQAAVR